MVDYLFVEGVSGEAVYWETVDMGSQIKDGDALATDIMRVKNDMEAVCKSDVESGQHMVLTVTTDRAKANVVAWAILEKHMIQGVPDAVHVHHSVIGDLFSRVAFAKEGNEQAYKVVKTLKSRPRVYCAFKVFQKQRNFKVLSFVKARGERLGSKVRQSMRLLKMKKALKEFVHKSCFKKAFAKKDLELRNVIAEMCKTKKFWTYQKYIVKMGWPILKNMRLCDSRTDGKAGLLFQGLHRMHEQTMKHVEKCSHKVMLEADKLGPNSKCTTPKT